MRRRQTLNAAAWVARSSASSSSNPAHSRAAASFRCIAAGASRTGVPRLQVRRSNACSVRCIRTAPARRLASDCRDQIRRAQGLEAGCRRSDQHLRRPVRVAQPQVLGQGLQVHQSSAHVLNVERIFRGMFGRDRLAAARHLLQQRAGVARAGERSRDCCGDRGGGARVAG